MKEDCESGGGSLIYSLKIHSVPGAVIKTSDKLVNVSFQCISFIKLNVFFQVIYNVPVFITLLGTICSLLSSYCILPSIDSRLTYYVRIIMLRMNSHLDVLYINIFLCTSNFLEFEACINTHTLEFSIIY